MTRYRRVRNWGSCHCMSPRRVAPDNTRPCAGGLIHYPALGSVVPRAGPRVLPDRQVPSQPGYSTTGSGVKAIGTNSYLLAAAGLCCLLASPAAADGLVPTNPNTQQAAAVADATTTSDASEAAVQDVLPAEPVGAPTQGSRWQFSVSPYLWMSGLNGELGVSEQVQPVGVDLPFTKILGALKFALMGTFEARHDRFVATGDMLYINLRTSDDLDIREADFVDGELRSKIFMSTVAAGYRAVDQGRLSVDILAGARLMSMKTGLDLQGPQRTFSGSASETWIDPIVAVRFQAPLGPRWALQTYGDIGGFGVGSHLSWQLQAMIDYELSRRWSLSGGWRHLDIDFDNNGFVFDAALDGPIIRAVYRF
jgi:hypothetical protein